MLQEEEKLELKGLIKLSHLKDDKHKIGFGLHVKDIAWLRGML